MDTETLGCVIFSLMAISALFLPLGLTVVALERRLSGRVIKKLERYRLQEIAPLEDFTVIRDRESNISVWLPLAAPILVSVTTLILVRYGSSFILLAALNVLSLVAAFTGGMLHYRSNASRSTKYWFLFLAVALWWSAAQVNFWTITSSVEAPAAVAVFRGSEVGCGILAGGGLSILTAVAIFFMMAIYIRYRYRYRINSSQGPPKSIRRDFYITSLLTPYWVGACGILGASTQTIDPYLLSQIFPALGTPNIYFDMTIINFLPPAAMLLILVLRFYIRGEMARWPILYMRSFKSRDAISVFKNVVMRSARKVGVVYALAHRMQPPTELQEDVAAEDQAHLFLAPETAWRPWIEEVLKNAFIAIFDLTITSESLSWELSEALRLLPSKRVLILYNSPTAPDICNSVSCLRYGSSEQEIRESRAHVDLWLRKNALE